MKNLFLIPFLVFAGQILSAQPEIKFDEKIKKFEKTKAGEILSFEYTFINTGNEPLLITDVIVTCGCTTPEFSKEPIKPGEKGKIHIGFDTKGKTGYQDRVSEVISNAKNSPEKIRFKGVVENEKK